MAADVVLGADSSNPCCAELKKRYQKLEEKRNALRQAVKLLEQQIDKLDGENKRLKKISEEQKLQIDQEKEAKEKESIIRNKLEKEVQDLRAELSSYQKSGCLRTVQEDENQLLKARVLNQNDEIKRVKELLQKEQSRADSEKKKAESEKKKAAEAWKLVKKEKANVEEERRVAEIERKKSEECRLCLEKVKLEANEMRERLNAVISKAADEKKKVEMEKQKINGEKKRTDSERTKVEEYKRLMEVERKKAFDGKVEADFLFQKLEEERQRREELQKKMEEIVSGAKGCCGSCFGGGGNNCGRIIEAADIKLLKERLKLEKRQAKHAKKIAKLAKAEKNIIIQELNLLKHSFMQILCRFNMLDGHLSQSIEGIDGRAKIGRSSDVEGFKLHGDQPCSMEDNHNLQIGFGLTETCCICSFNCTEPTGQCVCLPLSRGSCTRPTAGIISEVESPIGGSVRNKSQSSAVCSTTTSFSDRKLMGSQEQDSIVVTTSAKLAEKDLNRQSTTQKLPNKVAKIRKNKNAGVVAKNIDRSSGQREVGNACLKSSSHKEVKVAGQVSDRCSKKRKIRGTMKSVEGLYSEYDQLHLKIREKFCALRDLLDGEDSLPAVIYSQNCGISKDLNDGSGLLNEEHDNLCRAKLSKVGENACVNQAGNAVSNQLEDLICFENMFCADYMKLLNLDDEADEARYQMAMQMPLSPTLPDIEFPSFQLYGEDDYQYVIEKENSLPFHSFDVMDLEIISNISNLESSTAPSNLLYSTKGSCLIPPQSDVNKQNMSLDAKQIDNVSKCNDKMDNMDTAPSVVNIEGAHRRVKPLANCLSDPNAFANVYGDLLPVDTNKPFPSSITSGFFSKSVNPYLLDEGEGDQNCTVEMHKMARATSVANGQLGCYPSTNSGLTVNQIDGKGNVPDGPAYSEGLSQVLNSEIWRSMSGDGNLLITENAKKIGIDHPLEFVGKRVAAKQTLSTSRNIEDALGGIDEVEHGRTPKCYVIFWNNKDEGSMSRILSAWNAFASQSFMVSQIDHMVLEVLDALTKETALLPEETVSIFLSLLLCNISNKISADSKIGNLLSCSKTFAGQINRALSDVGTKRLFEEVCQLDIFVSLIEDFLIERTVVICCDRLHEPLCCNDLFSRSIHLDGRDMCVFPRAATVDQFVAGCILLASVCSAADCFGVLLETSYNILRMCKNDVSWILLALHIFASVCGNKLFNLKSYSFLITALRSVVSVLEGGLELVSSSNVGCSFPPCEQCPFAFGAVCMDKFVNMLLDVLQDNTVTGIRNSHANKASAFSVDTSSSFTEREKEIIDSRSEVDCLRIDCDASCCIFKYKKFVAEHSDCFSESAFCRFTDIISLVELVGCYMSWEWTCDNIVPRLLQMLECSVSDEFSAALSVLIGQLGRFGIDAGGYRVKGVAELRCSLLMFLDTNITKKRSLPSQFAAVGALLNLLPLSFMDIVDEYEELLLDTSQSGHVKYIKDWFSQLSKDHQSLSRKMFGQAVFLDR